MASLGWVGCAAGWVGCAAAPAGTERTTAHIPAVTSTAAGAASASGGTASGSAGGGTLSGTTGLTSGSSTTAGDVGGAASGGGSSGGAVTCQACSGDADCGPGGLCVVDGAGTFCATACGAGDACADELTCTRFSGGGDDDDDDDELRSRASPRDGHHDDDDDDDDDDEHGRAGCYPAAGTCVSPTPDGGACADTWAGFASAFFTQRCLACHTFAASRDAVVDEAHDIRKELDKRKMPPDVALAPADVSRVEAWLDCGAP